jgi:hypothetical protein
MLPTAYSATSVLLCDPSNVVQPVALYRMVGPSLQDLQRFESNATFDVQVAVTDSNVVMTWQRTLSASNSSDVQVVTDSNGLLDNVVWLQGSTSSFARDASSSSAHFSSAIVSVGALEKQVVCTNVKITDNLFLSWFVQGSLVSFNAVLSGPQAWQVSGCSG